VKWIAGLLMMALFSQSLFAQEVSGTPVPDSPAPQKTVWVANLMRKKSSTARITNLKMTDSKLPVFLVAKDRDLRPTISVNGTFTTDGWTLQAQGLPVEVDKEKKTFEIPMHLRGRINECTLTAIGPAGEKQTETFYIYAPDAMEFNVISPWDHIVVSLAPLYLIYQQSGYGEYQSIAAQVSLRYTSPDKKKIEKFTDRFGYHANVDATVFTLASSPVERGPQLLEIKGNLTYQLDPVRTWQTSLLGGVSYLTMFSNGSSFGFSNLTAPDLGFRTRKTISPTTAYFGEVHYVALGLPFEQQGLNLHGGWTRMIKESRRIEYGLSYSGYSWHPTPETSVRVHELAFKAGISF
jgi:hypothetical protein